MKIENNHSGQRNILRGHPAHPFRLLKPDRKVCNPFTRPLEDLGILFQNMTGTSKCHCWEIYFRGPLDLFPSPFLIPYVSLPFLFHTNFAISNLEFWMINFKNGEFSKLPAIASKSKMLLGISLKKD